MPSRRILDQLSGLPKSLDGNAIRLGQMQGEGTYLVHGEVQGDREIKGVLLLAGDCRWRGNITADVVVVKGSVNGSITAFSKIELRDASSVSGKLSAPMIAIASLATVNGPIDEDAYVVRFAERRTH